MSSAKTYILDAKNIRLYDKKQPQQRLKEMVECIKRQTCLLHLSAFVCYYINQVVKVREL